MCWLNLSHLCLIFAYFLFCFHFVHNCSPVISYIIFSLIIPPNYSPTCPLPICLRPTLPFRIFIIAVCIIPTSHSDVHILYRFIMYSSLYHLYNMSNCVLHIFQVYQLIYHQYHGTQKHVYRWC